MKLLLENFEALLSVYDSSRFGLLISILLRSGCRVSELLAVRFRDVLFDSTLIIRASKNSCDRVILIDSKYLPFLDCANSEVLIFADYDRYFVYRIFKAYGIQLKKKGRVNYSVVHSLRACYVTKLYAAGVSKIDIAASVGLKSAKNVDYYLLS